MSTDNKKDAHRNHRRVHNKKIVEDMSKTMSETSKEPNSTDVQGSWTGVPYDDYDKPVQDSDDL